ncbi:futalosine hydrolase [Desulfovibrio sp. OttesenSCG-928-A18]|nr:futalosine hydrolase [Desulfovibrio sp. OttesenSCG-928-A18]
MPPEKTQLLLVCATAMEMRAALKGLYPEGGGRGPDLLLQGPMPATAFAPGPHMARAADGAADVAADGALSPGEFPAGGGQPLPPQTGHDHMGARGHYAPCVDCQGAEPACPPEAFYPCDTRAGPLPWVELERHVLSLLVCGVGPVVSAYSLGLALGADAVGARRPPGAGGRASRLKGVLNLGLAGAYAVQDTSLGSIVLADAESCPEFGIWRHDQAEPGPMSFPQTRLGGKDIFATLPLRSDKALGNMDLNCHTISLSRGTGATVAGVSGSRERAARMAAVGGALFENMEGFSLALGSACAGLDFVELRVVSNAAGLRPPEGWDLPLALEGLGKLARALFAGCTVITDSSV